MSTLIVLLKLSEDFRAHLNRIRPGKHEILRLNNACPQTSHQTQDALQ